MTTLLLIFAFIGVFILGVCAGIMLTRWFIKREIESAVANIGNGGLDLDALLKNLPQPPSQN